MRKNIVAGNWKMNKTLQEGLTLIEDIKKGIANKTTKCEVIVATPFIHLFSAVECVKNSSIAISAENCADKELGAYTGEVSASMIASTGAKYCILGHSERRAYYGETSDILKNKVLLALNNGIKPIFCIGETKEERQANRQQSVVAQQIEEVLFDLSKDEFENIILAYEPVWAIGTGLTATSDQAQEMHQFIRYFIEKKYGAKIADNTTILYGGSCNPTNAKELFSKPDVNGGLIGGASLKASDFLTIIDSF